MHVRFEITQFVDMCILIQTRNKNATNEPGFNLSLKEMLFESVDRQ